MFATGQVNNPGTGVEVGVGTGVGIPHPSSTVTAVELKLLTKTFPQVFTATAQTPGKVHWFNRVLKSGL
jgi:hypothetical protein